MKLLAVDTSSTMLGVAVMQNGQLLTEYEHDAKLTHSKILIKTVDFILLANNLKIRDIEKLCITIGPGSFTGIRIGLTFARTLAQFLKIEVVGLNTLDVLAADVAEGNYLVVPLIDALNGRVFAAKYDGRSCQRISTYLLDDIDKIFLRLGNKEAVFVGSGLNNPIVLKSVEKSGLAIDLNYYCTKTFPRASTLAKIGSKMKGNNYKRLLPFYLKSSFAESSLSLCRASRTK